EGQRRILQPEHELVDELDGEPDHDQAPEMSASGAQASKHRQDPSRVERSRRGRRTAIVADPYLHPERLLEHARGPFAVRRVLLEELEMAIGAGRDRRPAVGREETLEAAKDPIV